MSLWSIYIISDDLEWPWKAGREGQFFQADLRNYVRTFWPRTNKFGSVTRGDGRVLGVSQAIAYCTYMSRGLSAITMFLVIKRFLNVKTFFLHLCFAHLLLKWSKVYFPQRARSAVATRYARPSSPPWAPSASRAAEQTQRSSSFPRPIRSRGHRCTCLTR